MSVPLKESKWPAPEEQAASNPAIPLILKSWPWKSTCELSSHVFSAHLSNIFLYSNAIVAENLAFIGSVKDEVLDKEELCFALIKRLISLDSSGIENRYGISVESTDKPLEIIEKIANKKLFKVKGGELDYERTYLTILQDYKKGKITNVIKIDWTILDFSFTNKQNG